MSPSRHDITTEFLKVTPMGNRRPLSPKHKEARKLRKQRIKAFLNEPVREGNVLFDTRSKTINATRRAQDMRDKVDKILECLHQ